MATLYPPSCDKTVLDESPPPSSISTENSASLLSNRILELFHSNHSATRIDRRVKQRRQQQLQTGTLSTALFLLEPRNGRSTARSMYGRNQSGLSGERRHVHAWPGTRWTRPPLFTSSKNGHSLHIAMLLQRAPCILRTVI